MNDFMSGLEGFFTNLFGSGSSSPQQSGPDYADTVFADYPKGTNPWNNWDPSTEDFWAQVRANQASAPAIPSITDGVRRMTGPRPVEHISRPPMGEPSSLGHPASTTEAKPVVSSAGTKGTWTATDPRWAAMNDHQRAAAMALMEADGADRDDARHALAAMHNRATKEKVELGQHVSTRVYQPTFEPAQQKRLDAILAKPAFKELVGWSERRAAGQEADLVNGATHFLAHPKTMLALEAQNPGKYRSWRSWTGFDAKAGDYRGVLFRDRSHSFLTPQ